MGKRGSGGMLISGTPAEFCGVGPVGELWNPRGDPLGVLDGVRVSDMGEVVSSCSARAVPQPWNRVVSSPGLTGEKSRTAG